MNKIFKVIWNHSTQRLEVVSELARSHGKSSSKTDKRVALGTMALAIGVATGSFVSGESAAATSNAAWSSYCLQQGGVTTSCANHPLQSNGGSVHVQAAGTYAGLGANSNPSEWGTSIGANSTTGNGGSAVGFNTKATGGESSALGANAVASGTRAIAIGGANNPTNAAEAIGDRSIAIGMNSSTTGENATALGTSATATGTSSMALGRNTTATKAGATALGNEADATADFATALGHESNATIAGSVALGSGSATGAVVSTPSAVIRGTTYNFAGASAYSTVSVGNDSQKRTITNMAAGRISSDSTDAINGSQLFGVITELNKISETANPDTYFHVNENNPSQGEGNAQTNLGKIRDKAGARGAYSLTAGVNAKATVGNSTSIGYNSNASALNATALGVLAHAANNNTISIGPSATALAAQSIAIGRHANVTVEGASMSIAIGDHAHTSGADSIALGQNAGASNSNAYAIGSNAVATNVSSIALGYTANSSGRRALALGAGSVSSGFSAVALGQLSQATADNATSIGSTAVARGNGSVAVGNSTAVGERAHGSVALGNDSHIAMDATNSTIVGSGSNIQPNLVNTHSFGTNNTLAASHAGVVGNNNQLQNGATNTFIMGNNITATAANNVILGANSSESSVTTAKGVPSTIGDAKVGNITYSSSNFAGLNAAGIVSVGAQDAVRRIINVAAGNISSTSTDAINGSQLYFIAHKLDSEKADVTRKYTYSIRNEANALQNTNGEADIWTLKGDDSLSFGATNALKVTTDAAGNIVYDLSDSTKANITKAKTTVESGRNTTVKSGTNPDGSTNYVINAESPFEYVTENGEKLVLIDGKFYKEDQLEADGSLKNNAVAYTGNTKIYARNNGNTKQVVGNIANGNIANGSDHAVTGDQLFNYVNVNGTAATNSTGKVNFVNGTNTQVSVDNNGNIAYNVLNTTLNIHSSSTGGNIGSVQVPTGTNANNFVNALDIANIINSSGWRITADKTTGTNTGTNTEELINPGDLVKLIAGDNIDIKQENGNFTISTTAAKNGVNGKDGVTLTSITKENGVTTVTFSDGKTFEIRDGVDGAAGAKGDTGAAGKDGKNATASVVDNQDGTHTITVTDGNGQTSTTTVRNGVDGK
ncbi:hypothetical protein C5N92_10860, partial [Glaesserella australis]